MSDMVSKAVVLELIKGWQRDLTEQAKTAKTKEKAGQLRAGANYLGLLGMSLQCLGMKFYQRGERR